MKSQSSETLTIATVQFDLKKISEFDDFRFNCDRLVKLAKDKSCDLILFPEYFTLSQLVFEVAGKDKTRLAFKELLQNCESHSKSMYDLFESLAREHEIQIVAGTWPVKVGQHIYNRCHTFSEKGLVSQQDKIKMTRFELEQWMVKGAEGPLKSFKLNGFTCAVGVCFDAEFPELTQPLIEQGVDLILVPSNTDDQHGYWRVRYCCHARTIENQCFVAMSCCVGGDKAVFDIGAHYGQSAVFCPNDLDFPVGGVLELGELNREGLAVATLERKQLVKIQHAGTVLNVRNLRSDEN